VLGWHCRGIMLPFIFSQHGEVTGSENATFSRRGEFVSCKPWSEGIYSVRGKGRGAM